MRQPRGPKPKMIQLTERQRTILEQIVRRAQSAQCTVTRSKIILKANDGLNNQQIADDMSIHIQTSRKWRNRWAEAADQLNEIESELDDKALKIRIKEILGDAPRCGVPATFMPEQICQIEHYKNEMLTIKGRKLTGKEAASEWIAKYAKDFPT